MSFKAAHDLLLPVGIIACVLVILVPLPAGIIDFLLAANITVAVLMLLTTIAVRTPLEFSVFPTLLLATTLGRLVLNIATTRLILTQAHSDGLLAAGRVIQGFSQFVAGDRAVVGFVIFAIILLIQFVVITKGATRISEVAARFALDGLPGKQMSIDADLNAGVIDDQEAGRRREELAHQADFYGAMDGASKFVRGDAVAGLVITLVNFVGGLVVGMFEYGMPLAGAGDLFARLTIGDGLVSQVPAFLISLAAGLLITRSSTQTDLSNQFSTQLFSRPQTLLITAAFLAVLGFTRLPAVPLFALGGACVAISWVLMRPAAAPREEEADEEESESAAAADASIEELLHVDPMELEIGIGLIRLADPKRGGGLLERIQLVRRSVASELGIILPKVRIRDNVRLERHHYRIKIADVVVAAGNLRPSLMLAIDWGGAAAELDAEPTTDPAYGMPAYWIDSSLQDEAEQQGYTVVDATSVVATHLTEVIRSHADELLTRDATQQLLDNLKQRSPAVVEELVPDPLKVGDVQRVLQQLLREGIAIRHLEAILEAVSDAASRGRSPGWFVEAAREKLARSICHRFRDEHGTIRAVTLDPVWEDALAENVEETDAGTAIRWSHAQQEALVQALREGAEKLAVAARPAVVLVDPRIRRAVKEVSSAELPKLAVLSYAEITHDTKVQSVALLSPPASPSEIAPSTTT